MSEAKKEVASKKKKVAVSLTKAVQERERLLPALRYVAPKVAVFYALGGTNVEEGFRSVGTRMCQTLYPYLLGDAPELRGQRGTSGATGRWQGLLGTRASELSDEERENELAALLIARSMPSERISMASYMLAGLPKSQLVTLCQRHLGEKPGKAFAEVIRAIGKFVDASTQVVLADIKKKAGKTQNLTASASDELARERMARATRLLEALSE